MKVLVVFGTRPEAIKMAAVVQALRDRPEIETRVCVTGQHRSMLDQVLTVFGLVPDIDLNIMRPGQTLFDVTEAVMSGMRRVLTDEQPDYVLVHGDTTTAMAAALSAFYMNIPVGHVEAGLRSGNINHPWPEELNRRVIDELSQLHFAPTETAFDALIAAGHSARTIEVTGNTVIDALQMVSDRLARNPHIRAEMDGRFAFADPEKRLILVTGHRRENFGQGMGNLCTALCRLAARGDVEIVFPVHPNANVAEPVHRRLGKVANIHLIDPLDYLPFVYLLGRSYMVITDSGGIQEEAPALGKPVLVTRLVTERPEAIAAGTAVLVGTDTRRIVGAATELLDDPATYRRMSQAHCSFGDGRAAWRIADRLVRLGQHERPPMVAE